MHLQNNQWSGQNIFLEYFVCVGFLHDFSFTDLGVRQPRLEGEEYLEIVDEFMEAVHARWPKAIVQVCFVLKCCFGDTIFNT